MSDPEKTQEVSNAVQDVPQSPSNEQADMQELANVFGVNVPQEEAALEPKVELKEEVPAEPEKEEQKDVDSLKHDLQSWLGRKQGESNRAFVERLERIEQAIMKLNPGAREPETPINIPDIGIDLDEPIMTKREVIELSERTQQAKQKAQESYWQNYSSQLGKLAVEDKLDPDMVSKLSDELDKVLQNPISSTDPVVAAQLNYSKAMVNVLRKSIKPADPKLPIKNEKPNNAPGVIVSQKNDIKASQVIQLDADARKLQQAFNLSDDRVEAILKTK